MKRFLILSAAILAIVSCNPDSPKGSKIARFDTDYAPPIFPKEYKREITALNRGLLFETFGGMGYLCDSVFILRAKSTDNEHLFQALSTKDGHQITSFGNQGRATNELTDCSRVAYDNKSKHLYAMDMRLNMIDIDLGKALSGDVNYVIDNYKFESGVPARKLYFMPNNRILRVGMKPRFFITDMYGKDSIAIYDDYHPTLPEFDNNANLRMQYFATNAISGIKPDGTKIYHATGNGMVLEILDFDGTSIKQSALRYFYKPMKGDLALGVLSFDCIMGAIRSYATDKYVYLLYKENTLKEEMQPPFYLGVFDWNGNEVCRYVLNEFTNTFVVTPDDKRVYCWARDKDAEEYFGYFDLK